MCVRPGGKIKSSDQYDKYDFKSDRELIAMEMESVYLLLYSCQLVQDCIKEERRNCTEGDGITKRYK